MRLTVAIGVLAQSLLVASSKVWAPQKNQSQNGLAAMKRRLKQRDLRNMLKNEMQKNKELQLGYRRRNFRRRDRRTRNLGAVKNVANKMTRDMCNEGVDVGILACPKGQECIAGYCHPSTDRQSGNSNAAPQPLAAIPSGVDPAEVFCDSTSLFYYDVAATNDFDSCDCSGVTLGTAGGYGTGTFTCGKANYCFDPPLNNFCADISFEAVLPGSPYFTYTYCYSLTSPQTQELCYQYNTDPSVNTCAISVDNTLCNSCYPADSASCPNYYNAQDIASFDCLNVPTGLAGDNCASYGSYYYATTVVQDAVASYAFATAYEFICNYAYSYTATDDGAYGGILGGVGASFQIACGCQNIDTTARSFDISCTGSYNFGPYNADLTLEGSIDVSAPGYESYSLEVCYDFTSPSVESYCYGTDSTNPYVCTLSINDNQCAYCAPPTCDYTSYNGLSGVFDCTNVGYTSGDGCNGDFASPLAGALFNFEQVVITVDQETIMNVVMDIFGISDLSGMDLDTWIELTEDFIEAYFENNPGLGIFNLEVEIIVIDVFVAGEGGTTRNRILQTQSDFVTVVFNQENSFMQDPASFVSLADVAALPFSTLESREDYVELLQDAGGLTDITGVTDVMVGEAPDAPTPAPIQDRKRGKRGKAGKSGKKRGKSSKKSPKSIKYSKKTKLENRNDRYGKGKGKGGKRR